MAQKRYTWNNSLNYSFYLNIQEKLEGHEIQQNSILPVIFKYTPTGAPEVKTVTLHIFRKIM